MSIVFSSPTFSVAADAPTGKTKINIGVFIAQERGGTGDITSNILAAIQLKKVHPEWNVFLVEPTTISSNEVLRDVLPRSEKKALLEGIELISREEFAKRKLKNSRGTNIALQFSAPVTTNDTKAKEWANQTWIFTEFSIPFWKKPDSHDELSVSNVAKRFNTGPEALGMYIGRRQPKPPMGINALKRKIAKFKDKSVDPATVKGRHTQIAYSYATNYDNTKKYVDFVYNAANTKYANEKIQLIVYDPEPANFDNLAENKPENVELVVLHHRPLSLGMGIMSHATLPMLLTGDIGPTLAIEYNKPFFMETHDHKKDFRDRLIDKLSTAMTYGNIDKLKKSWDFDRLNGYEFNLIKDPTLWKQLREGVKEFRKSGSLTENIADFITENHDAIHCMRSLTKSAGN